MQCVCLPNMFTMKIVVSLEITWMSFGNVLCALLLVPMSLISLSSKKDCSSFLVLLLVKKVAVSRRGFKLGSFKYSNHSPPRTFEGAVLPLFLPLLILCMGDAEHHDIIEV